MLVFGFGYGGRFSGFVLGVTKLILYASEAYTQMVSHTCRREWL